MGGSSVGKFDRIGGDRDRVLLDAITISENEQTIGLGIVEGGAKLPAVVDDADELQARRLRWRRRSPRHECIARSRGRGWIPEANDEGALIDPFLFIFEQWGRSSVNVEWNHSALVLFVWPPGPQCAKRNRRATKEPCEAQ